MPNSSMPAPRRSPSQPGLWPDRVESYTPRLLRAYDGYAEVDVPVLQGNGSSFTDMGSGKEISRVCRADTDPFFADRRRPEFRRDLECGLRSFVDLIYLRDSETKELVAGDMRHCARRQHTHSCPRARHPPPTPPTPTHPSRVHMHGTAAHSVSPHTRAALSGAALSDQDNNTRWQFTYSKSVKFVDVYANHDEYGLWVQVTLILTLS